MSPAPVVYLGNDEGAILIDYPHGRGRIVLLSDPYVVANNGISLKDNLQLALNLVTTSKGLTASMSSTRDEALPKMLSLLISQARLYWRFSCNSAS